MTTTFLLALLLCHTAIVASAAAAPPSPTAELPVTASPSDTTSRTPQLRFDLVQEQRYGAICICYAE